MAEVGKVKISNLPLASSVSDNDAMLIVQNGSAKRVMPSLMKGKQGDKGDDGKTGQGFAYKWDGTNLVLGTIAVGSSIIKWGAGVNLKGEPGDEGLTGSGSYVEQSGTKVRFGQSAVGQTSVTWGEYIQLRGSDAIYQWDGTSLKMGTRTYTVDGSTEEYSAGVDLKGEQGLRGVHGTDLYYVWEGTSLKLGRITYREDGTQTLTFSDPVNLQGYRGEQGLQPAMQMGDVITLNPEETASATFVKDGTTTEGADIYKLNLSIPRGMAGKEGMPRIPSAVLSLKSESTSDEIFAAWGGKDAMLAVGTSFLAGEKSNCLMSGNATLYFAYTDADNFQLDILFRLKGKENQYEHWVVDGEATLTVTTYDNVHVNNASTMKKGKQYAFEPDTDGSASGVMKEVTVITQEEKDKINGTYSKEEIDSTFATKANTYTKDKTYTKEEVDAKIPAPLDAYTKTEADNKFALLSSQPYFFNPSVLNSLSTNSSYSVSGITERLGMTLREFVANYGDRIVFKEYMGALAYNQDSAGTLAEFTYYVNNKIRVVKIIHEDADTTCNVTVTEKQLVTNIMAMSESNYANLSSKDSSTLYLVY